MSRRSWVLFAAMCVLWGVPYLLIKVAVSELRPAEFVFARTALGALALLPWALRSGALRPALRCWRPVLLFAGLEMAGPWLLLAVAETTLSSSLTGLLVAGVPLVAAVAGRVAGEQDRLDRRRVTGLLVGLAGVAVLLGLDVRGSALPAVAAVGLVVLGYATGPLVVSRALRGVPSEGVNAAALTVTAVLFLPLAAPGSGRLSDRPPSAAVVAAVLVLGLVCTALALVLFFALIAEAGPHRALVITYVNPAVALVLGVVLLGEPLTAGMLLGFPLVLAGCALATRRSAASALQPAGGPAGAAVRPIRRAGSS